MSSEKQMNPTERMIGREIEFQDECTGLIVDETEDAIYILSDFFTGWMFKAEYFELLGEAGNEPT